MNDPLVLNLCAYDAWADRAAIASLASVPVTNAAVARLVAHLAAAKEIWLQRILANPSPPTDRFPALAIPEAIRRLDAIDAGIAQLLATSPDLDQIISYRDIKGTPHTNRLGDILLHLFNHGTYHRGQLATAIKAAGGEPAVTDYIAWVRHRS